MIPALTARAAARKAMVRDWIRKSVTSEKLKQHATTAANFVKQHPVTTGAAALGSAVVAGVKERAREAVTPVRKGYDSETYQGSNLLIIVGLIFHIIFVRPFSTKFG
ncbi:hypothetical protein DRJ25_06205, partial [Candidatus Woesearchaeota archaeon]